MHFYKTLLVICFLYASSFPIEAQAQQKVKYFSLHLGSGVTNARVNHAFGPDKAKSRMGTVPSLKFNWSKNVVTNWNRTTGFQLGIYPHEISSINGFEGRYSYFNSFIYVPYFQPHIGIEHQKRITKNIFFTSQLNYAPRFMFGLTYGSISTDAFNNSIVTDGSFNSANFTQFEVSASLSRVFQSGNFLTYGLYAQLGWGVATQGMYEITIGNSTSKGSFIDRGNYLGAHIGYAFAKDLKRDKKQEREDRKSFKNQLSTELGFGPSYWFTKDPRFENTSPVGSNFGINYTRFRNQKFIRFRFGYHQQWLQESRPKFGNPSSGMSSFYETFNLDVGVGYSFYLNQWNLMDLQGGLSLGISNIPKGIATYSVTGEGSPLNHNYLSYWYEFGNVESRFQPLAYVEISRNFYLGKKLFFSAGYRFNQGFGTYAEKLITITEDSPYGEIRAKEVFTGTSTSTQLGFGAKF